MIALKQQFHGIANTHAMSGKGADAIKAFYTEQVSGAELWLDLCDMKITFFKSIPREIEQAGFGQHDLLEESFLESELNHAGNRAHHIIDGQHGEISRILGSIDDILSLSPFDKSSVTGKQRNTYINSTQNWFTSTLNLKRLNMKLKPFSGRWQT